MLAQVVGLCRVTVVALLIGSAAVGAAIAQGAGGLDRSSLGALLDSLRQLQQSGSINLREPGGQVDRSRVNAERQALSRQEQRRLSRLARGAVLEPEAEEMLIDAFCKGRLTSDDERFLRLIPRFSSVEKDYCRRLREPISQIGYDIFRSEPTEDIAATGTIPEDYRLGIGDDLIITFVGPTPSVQTYTVDREGRVTLLNLAPIGAAGLTLAEFRRELKVRIDAGFVGTQAFVSVGAVRMINVNVVGEVDIPGSYQLTALASILDALRVSGGVKKTGSLRRIHLQRGTRMHWVDVYDLFFGTGPSTDLRLADGDRIIVPVVGETVSVAGDVKRAGIFELPEGATRANVGEVLAMAGGSIRPTGNVFRRVSLNAAGREDVEEFAASDFQVRSGDIIVIGRLDSLQTGIVHLAGNARGSSQRALRSAPTVAALLRDVQSLGPDPYLPFAVLDSSDPVTRSRRLYALNPLAILEGREDFSLRDGDRVIVFGNEDIRFLASDAVQRAGLVSEGDETRDPVRDGRRAGPTASTNVPSAPSSPDGEARNTTNVINLPAGLSDQLLGRVASATSGSAPQVPGQPASLSLRNCKSIQHLTKVQRERGTNRRLDVSAPTPGQESERNQPVSCRDVFEQDVDLLPFALEHVVHVRGEVRRPGRLPVGPGVSLSMLLAAAGGVTLAADPTRIEVASASTNDQEPSSIARRVVVTAATGTQVSLLPGDAVQVASRFIDRETGPIILGGEFIRPGTYEIRRGERLSEVIARAGGLTPQAYPYGAVFTRESVRRAEELALQRLARELNASAATAIASRALQPGDVAAVVGLAREVAAAPAVGRIVIEADPLALAVKPELDTILEPGDRLIIPKRPNSVLVTGEVLSPGAMQFASGAPVDRYVRQAGGLQQSADQSRIFVVYPNGSAQPVSISAFNYTPVRVPPGSTIVVPKDPRPFDLLALSKDLSTVLGQLAVTAASLAVISR